MITTLGISKQVKMFLLMKEMVCYVVMDWTASTSAHMLKWSTTTITNFLKPVTFEKGPKISNSIEKRARVCQLPLAFCLEFKECLHVFDIVDTSGRVLLFCIIVDQ